MQTTTETNLENPEFQRFYVEEGFVVSCLEQICTWMKTHNIDAANLAQRLGTSPAIVTRMLRGRNIHLRTLARIAYVLGGTPEFRIAETAPQTSEGDLETLRLLDEWWERGTFATGKVRDLAGLVRAHRARLLQIESPDLDSPLEEVPPVLLQRVTDLAENGPSPEIRAAAIAFLTEITDEGS